MKQVLRLAAVAASLTVAQAHADAQHFTGFRLGASANFISTSAEVHNGVFSGSIGDTDAMLSVQGGHTWDLGGRWLLGLTGSRGYGYLKAGSVGSTFFQVKDIYALHVEPGYLLNPSTQLYAKVGYLQMRSRVVETAVAKDGTDYRGVGYGAGLRILLEGRWYLEMEVLQTEYSELRQLTATYNPSTTTASLGLGWRF